MIRRAVTPTRQVRLRHENLTRSPDVHGSRSRHRKATCRGVGRRDFGHECEGVDPMGRGRAKAKQTKVARDLKYRSHETDLSALAQELHGTVHPPSDSTEDAVP